jgi:hypothetical protein
MTASITCPIKKYIFRLSKNKEQNIGKRTKSESVFAALVFCFPRKKTFKTIFYADVRWSVKTSIGITITKKEKTNLHF